MTQPMSARDIQRWFPNKWNQIAGNAGLIMTCRAMIRNGPCNLLVTGPARTGKTRTISLLIRALVCTNRSITLDPCGICDACKAVGECRYDHNGLLSAVTHSSFSYIKIDCTKVEGDRLKKLWTEIDLETPRTIIYLDEIAALGRRNLEQLLLAALDQSRCCFFASAVSVRKPFWAIRRTRVDGLSIPVQGRFGIKVGTSYPSVEELTTWIPARCIEWSIDLFRQEETIRRIIKKTGSRVGYIVNLLSSASAHGGKLGPEEVDKFNVDPLE